MAKDNNNNKQKAEKKMVINSLWGLTRVPNQ